MQHVEALNGISKYIAQSKEWIVKYLEENDIENTQYLNEAIKLLDIALDNVIV